MAVTFTRDLRISDPMMKRDDCCGFRDDEDENPDDADGDLAELESQQTRGDSGEVGAAAGDRDVGSARPHALRVAARSKQTGIR
jgi:hypothetical protein